MTSPMRRSSVWRGSAGSPRRWSGRSSKTGWTSRCTATKTCRSRRNRRFASWRHSHADRLRTCSAPAPVHVLPVAEESALRIVATLPRGPVEDVLCARAGARLASLPPGGRVGTSSLRRLAQLRLMRPDLSYVPLRGNVPTRLDRVARGDLDAVVLARAGLERLGFMDRVSEVFPVASVLPAPGQGALAIQTRALDREMTELAAALDHAPTHRAVRAEREVLRRLRGGCSVPVGVSVRAGGAHFPLAAGVFATRGSEALRVELEGADPI